MPIISEGDCEHYCRDYMRIDYPIFRQLEGFAYPNVQCFCSTGAGCEDRPSPSSGNILGAWVSGVVMVTAAVMATAL
eukprot:scaffold22618_cov171-Skeletonema_menzelii.AAC.1